MNAQLYLGIPAIFSAYSDLLNPHDRNNGLFWPWGGHLTHGYYTSGGKKILETSIYLKIPYKLDPSTGYTDYVKLEEKALDFRPRMIVSGGSDTLVIGYIM